MVRETKKALSNSPSLHRHRRQSEFQTFASKGGLGDSHTTDILRMAAAIWWQWWAAVNQPSLLESGGQNLELISSGSIWARATNAAAGRIDLAKEAKLHRHWAGSHVKILDSIISKDFSIKACAIDLYGSPNKLALERTRQSLRDALHWVASVKNLWGT